MKKTLNIFSIIVTILIVLGALFKFMHYPGASLMLILSMGCLSLGFIPVYAKYAVKEFTGRKIKFTVSFGYFCLSLLNLGILSKIMHWPLSGLFLVASMGFFSLFFLPAWSIYKMRRAHNRSEKLMFLFGGVSVSLLILGLMLKIMHYPFANVLIVLGVLLLLSVYLPFLVKAYKHDPGKKSEALVRLTITSVLATTLVAFMFGSASRIFMNSFALTQEGIEATSKNINSRSVNILASLQNETTAKQKATKVKELSDNLFNYIGDMKSMLVSKADDISIQEADSLSPYNINNKDNYDIPTRVMLGDVENLREGSFSAKELKNKIIVFREDILGMLGTKKRNEVAKTIGLLLEDVFEKEDARGLVKWEIYTFYNLPVAGVLNILAQLQNNVRLAENVVMTNLLNESLSTKVEASSEQ